MLTYLLLIADEDKKEDVIFFFNKYHAEMLIVARVRFKNAGMPNFELEAEDAVQNAFVKITRHINTIKGKVKKENVRAYLFAIVENEINEIIAEITNSKTVYADVENLIDDEDFIRRLEIKDRYNNVVEAIKLLDEKYSSVLLFHFCGEMKVPQLAKLLGLKPTTVYTRIEKGKRLLLELLKEEGKI